MRPFAWLSVFYIAIYFTYGAYIPFWSLWLSSRGISADQIGLLIGLGLAIRFAGNLVIMGRVNRASRLLPACRWIALLSIAGFALFYWTHSFIPLLLLMLAANFIYPTILPLSEGLAARMVLQVKLDYGRVRLWGSAAFILGSTLVGALVHRLGPEWVLYTILIGLVLLFLFTWMPMSPAPQDTHEKSRQKSGFMPLLKDRPFLCLMLVESLLQGSHAAYYSFSTLHWKEHGGLMENQIGYLWALGVLAEICMFAASKRLLRNVSYQQMFYVGAVGCLVRWSALAMTTDWRILALAQLLHSVTFCVSHLAAIRYITRHLPAEYVIPAQTLYAALPTGIITALLTMAAGVGYQHYAGATFWAMAALVLPVFFLRVRQPGEALRAHHEPVHQEPAHQ